MKSDSCFHVSCRSLDLLGWHPTHTPDDNHVRRSDSVDCGEWMVSGRAEAQVGHSVSDVSPLSYGSLKFVCLTSPAHRWQKGENRCRALQRLSVVQMHPETSSIVSRTRMERRKSKQICFGSCCSESRLVNQDSCFPCLLSLFRSARLASHPQFR